MLDRTTNESKTAFSAAFARQGLRPEDAALDVALALYRNNGGTFERLLERGKIAFAGELPRKGQIASASDGHYHPAQPRQPVEDDGGQRRDAGSGHIQAAPSSSSDRGGDGQYTRAGNGQSRCAPPASEPSAADRAASLKVQRASAIVALTSLDRIKTSDGKPWGSVCAHELAGMRRDGILANAIADWMGPLNDEQRFKPIRDLMNDRQFELVLARVRGQNHAA